MRTLLLFILLMAFAAPLLADNDSTAQRTHYIIFKSKGSSPALVEEAAEQKAEPSSAATINPPLKKNTLAPADTAERSILHHEYEVALPDTLIDDDEPVKKKPKKEPGYVTAGKILLLAAMAVLALNAALSVAGGVIILVIGIVLLALEGSTLVAVAYTIIGALSLLTGGLTLLGLYKLMKIPFFDSVLRWNKPRKPKEETKPRIFN